MIAFYIGFSFVFSWMCSAYIRVIESYEYPFYSDSFIEKAKYSYNNRNGFRARDIIVRLVILPAMVGTICLFLVRGIGTLFLGMQLW